MTRINHGDVTGAGGFVGRHLMETLGRRADCRVMGILRCTPDNEARSMVGGADIVFHLAGTNRPEDPSDFERDNVDLTRRILGWLQQRAESSPPMMVLASSIQASLDNPYGRSKRDAERVTEDWAASGAGMAVIYRLRNIFGKWSRPNYNSVTATFCHNVARGLPINVTDPSRELELVYIDDVIAEMTAVLGTPPDPGRAEHRQVLRSFRITLGALADRIVSFRESRTTQQLPSFGDPLTRFLYATYLSHLEPPDLTYPLLQRTDPRGSLAEFLKSPGFGQIFVSRTMPGIRRGDHFHHTKTEKFLVLEGQALIRFRPIAGPDVYEHRVDGQDLKVVDIPPGCAHSIENVGSTPLVTLFWASEIFDQTRPDTYATMVQ